MKGTLTIELSINVLLIVQINFIATSTLDKSLDLLTKVSQKVV